MEDQDQWWLSGIHRHVRLYSKPRRLSICDYYCTSSVAADGGSALVELRVALQGDLDSTADLDSPADLDSTAGLRSTGASGLGWRVTTSLHGPMQLVPGEAAPDAAGGRFAGTLTGGGRYSASASDIFPVWTRAVAARAATN